MLLERFSDIIERSRVGASVEDKRRLLLETNPDRIYVENVRSFLHVPRFIAKWMLDLAVKKGVMEKRVGILCKNSSCERLIGDYPIGEEPDEVSCRICEASGEEEAVFATESCKKIEFYRMNREPSDDRSREG